MQLLIIDYLSPRGHINFDQIHINALIELGYKVHLVGRKGQYPAFVGKPNVEITEIPEFYYKSYPLPTLTDIIKGVLCLKWIKKRVKLEKYWSVIFLSYDTLTIPFFRTTQSVYLINHNNVDQIENTIKLKLLERLPFNYIHIALNNFMYDRLKELFPDKQIYSIPHGYLAPSANCRKPAFLINKGRVLFCPVNRNIDKEVMDKILNSKTFNKYLQDNNILLFVKEQLCSDSLGNVKRLGNLENEEYNYMLNNSMAVLLPYGDGFKYRCSGILFECVARNTPVIATNRKALLIYKDEINIHYFHNEDSLIEAIETIQSVKDKNFDTNHLQPVKYWGGVLNL